MDESPQPPTPAERPSDPTSAGAPPSNSPDSAEQRLELAMRLLGQQRNTSANDLRLLPGRLPTDLPLALPLPAGARIVGSMTQTPPNHEPVTTMLVDAPLAPEQCAQFYIEQLEALGWTQTTMPHMGGGFVHVQPGGFAFLRFISGAGDHALTISTLSDSTERATALSMMIVRVEQGFDGPHGRMRPGRPPMRQAEALVPSLMPPPGAGQQGEGGGGGMGHWHSNARLETSHPLAEVIAHYDRQLARGGWSRSDGGVSGPVGWSVWAFADEEGQPWHGIFLALNRIDKPHEYFLLIQIHAEGESDRQGSSFTMGTLSGR